MIIFLVTVVCETRPQTVDEDQLSEASDQRLNDTTDNTHGGYETIPSTRYPQHTATHIPTTSTTLKASTTIMEKATTTALTTTTTTTTATVPSTEASANSTRYWTSDNSRGYYSGRSTTYSSTHGKQLSTEKLNTVTSAPQTPATSPTTTLPISASVLSGSRMTTLGTTIIPSNVSPAVEPNSVTLSASTKTSSLVTWSANQVTWTTTPAWRHTDWATHDSVSPVGDLIPANFATRAIRRQYRGDDVTAPTRNPSRDKKLPLFKDVLTTTAAATTAPPTTSTTAGYVKPVSNGYPAEMYSSYSKHEPDPEREKQLNRIGTNIEQVSTSQNIEATQKPATGRDRWNIASTAMPLNAEIVPSLRSVTTAAPSVASTTYNPMYVTLTSPSTATVSPRYASVKEIDKKDYYKSTTAFPTPSLRTTTSWLLSSLSSRMNTFSQRFDYNDENNDENNDETNALENQVLPSAPSTATKESVSGLQVIADYSTTAAPSENIDELRWTPWTEWSNCSRVCGCSRRTRTRHCLSNLCR